MKNFSGALFIPKVPLETGAPPHLFDASYAPASLIDYCKLLPESTLTRIYASFNI
jgi:hypothetical protein